MDNIDLQINSILERAAPKPVNDNQILRSYGRNLTKQSSAQKSINIIGNNNVIISSSAFWLLCITVVYYIILFSTQH